MSVLSFSTLASSVKQITPCSDIVITMDVIVSESTGERIPYSQRLGCTRYFSEPKQCQRQQEAQQNDVTRNIVEKVFIQEGAAATLINGKLYECVAD